MLALPTAVSGAVLPEGKAVVSFDTALKRPAISGGLKLAGPRAICGPQRRYLRPAIIIWNSKNLGYKLSRFYSFYSIFLLVTQQNYYFLTCVHFSGATCWYWQRPTLAQGNRSPSLCVYPCLVISARRPVARVGCVTPPMSFLDYLQSSTNVFKREGFWTIVCTICHSVCYWCRTCFQRSPDGGIRFAVWHHSEAVFSTKKYPKLVSAAAEIWQCLAVCICLWTVLLIKELNEDQQICFAMETNGQTLHATLRLSTTRDFKPNVNSLASAKCCQISGQSSSETEKIWSSELCCHSYLL